MKKATNHTDCVVRSVICRVETRAHERQANENDELYRFADTLVYRISCETNIVKSDLKPAGPQDSKEPDVCDQVVVTCHGMVGSKSGEIGDEEQVKEQFNRIGLMSLGKNELLVVGTLEWGFDQSARLVHPLEMLFGIPTRFR